MTRLVEVARFTKHPHANAEFYANLLGQKAPEAGGDMYHFEVDGVQLLVHEASDQTEPGWPDDVDHVAFAVDDLDTECERLKALGYTITGPTQFPWGRSAYLYDPDGRMVELTS
jgi:predicted enzyme related to lactoylglutathione lyase